MRNMDEDGRLNHGYHFKTTARTKDLLALRATEDGVSVNAVINKAVTVYLTKDTTDESLIMAKLSDIQRQIGRLKNRTDVREKLLLEFFQYFFLFAPPLPQEELPVRMKKANQDVQGFLLNFRHRAAAIKPLIETIFGDMLEEDAEAGG